jgi:N6-adenosine-specific RNA methylase IME4
MDRLNELRGLWLTRIRERSDQKIWNSWNGLEKRSRRSCLPLGQRIWQSRKLFANYTPSPLTGKLMSITEEPMCFTSRELPQLTSECKFATILADPPWQFRNRTGKIAPEHRRLSRYSTLDLEALEKFPIKDLATETAHLYLWCPNALLPDGLVVMKSWGFRYKSNIVWHKVRKDGGSDGRGVGFYFRNVTELLLFGVRGKNARTLAAGRRQVNLLATRKREHSRKPDEQYAIIEACSPGPYLELFARGTRKGWVTWGDQADAGYRPTWQTYAHHSRAELAPTA